MGFPKRHIIIGTLWSLAALATFALAAWCNSMIPPVTKANRSPPQPYYDSAIIVLGIASAVAGFAEVAAAAKAFAGGPNH